MSKKFIILLSIILLFNVTVKTTARYVDVSISVQNSSFYDGPIYMGIGAGHSSINGNWLKFFQRLGVNAARRFVAAVSDLRGFIGSIQWGQDLNGQYVTDQTSFKSAIATLRTPNGRDINYSWKNPVRWNDINAGFKRITQQIYGSDENILNQLKSVNISTLVVEHISCSSSSTHFKFETQNPSDSNFWKERWELYKFSYAIAIWAWNNSVEMIEFYNEPDIDLDTCLDVDHFKQYYFIRSLSIQNAYADMNNSNPTRKINVKIAASAFARKTYGGDPTRYLGDICVLNRNYMFDTNTNNSNWSNMQAYSYHTYGKTGYEMFNDFQYLSNSVNQDTSYPFEIPVILTEHNVHSASSWDVLSTTADDPQIASQLASQIMYLVVAKVTIDFVFKFSITPSFSLQRDIAKNGLHWGEITVSPYHIADTTLSAEAMRLLMTMKQSKIYSITTNDTSKYRKYLASKNNDGRYYVYIVNDKNETANAALDLSSFKIVKGAQIIIETVSVGYWGEISSITSAPAAGTRLLLNVTPYSTTRLTVHPTVQTIASTNSNLSCTARAGLRSNEVDCSSSSIFIGTSNTAQHENTSVSLISFEVNKNVPINQKTILSVSVQEVIGNDDVTVLVLGLANQISLNSNSISWNSLSSQLSILNPLNSGTVIDSISKNFINWSSPSNLTVVGHISAFSRSTNVIRMIDVSDYISNVISSSGSSFTFLLYRPFRHPSYQTSAGPIPADDLSNGSLIKLSSNAQLTHYWQQE